MLMEELFASGIMTMGPSRVAPERQVGVFAPGRAEAAIAARTAKLEAFRWIEGDWRYENAVPAGRLHPAYGDVGQQTFQISDDGWVASRLPNGSLQRLITFDGFGGQWIYALTRGSYGVLRSAEGWRGAEISFTGLMTMLGLDREWRMTWTRLHDDRFQFVNEERAADGTWSYIDEWRFERVAVRSGA